LFWLELFAEGGTSLHLWIVKIQNDMIQTYFPVALRLLAAAILLQTLFFKFSSAEESVWIFQQLGIEPWGRLGSGVAELLCAVLLIFPKTAWLGALGGLGVMRGNTLAATGRDEVLYFKDFGKIPLTPLTTFFLLTTFI
jgi:uncharacterized membrane protein YphA (DoxX/SURF4 family)